MRTTIQRVKQQLIKIRHTLLRNTGQWLGRVVRGWFNYYAVPGNLRPKHLGEEDTGEDAAAGVTTSFVMAQHFFIKRLNW